MTFRAYLGTADLTNVELRTYLRDTQIGSVVTSFTDEGNGWYRATASSTGIDNVRWQALDGSDAVIDGTAVRQDLSLLTQHLTTFRYYFGPDDLDDIAAATYNGSTLVANVTDIVNEGGGYYSIVASIASGDHLRVSSATGNVDTREDFALRSAIQTLIDGQGAGGGGSGLTEDQAAAIALIPAIKAKTDNLPASPAATSDIPTAAAVSDAVWDETLSDHLTSGTTGAGLNAAGSAGDPWGTALPGDYDDGTAGAIIGRFNVPPVDSPLIVIPGPPIDASLCRVFGYFEKLDNSATQNGIKITFSLTDTPSAVKSERLLDPEKIVATIESGNLTNASGNSWQDLQRNDKLSPAGTSYRVTCPELRLRDVKVTLASDTFDLSSIVPSLPLPGRIRRAGRFRYFFRSAGP